VSDDVRSTGSRTPLSTRLPFTGTVALRALTAPRIPFRSPAAIERAQRRRLRSVVRYAYRHVPYYRETMDQLGLRPGDVRTVADLKRLPLIDREQLQRDPLRFASHARSLDRYFRTQTGGSSGAPVTVFRDPLSLRGVGHNERGAAVAYAMIGKGRRLRALNITSPASPSVRVRSAVNRRLLLPGRMRMQRRTVSLLDPLPQTLAAINEFRPDLIASYGSYLEALFLHAYHTGADFHRPTVVVYSADALSERARRLISETFGIEVLAAYSAVEASAAGFECEEHLGLHLNCDLYPMRIIGEDGDELPDGEVGEVVVSNLVNRGTVLLNYRLGDMASKHRGRCPCGRSLPLLSFLDGRVGDWIATRSGERMHPQTLLSILVEQEDLWHYQVVQRSVSHFALKLVTSPRCDRRRLQARLADRFVERLGEGTTIEVSFVEALSRTPRGKIRTVVGLPGDESSAAAPPARAARA
jgi:phenylacetate-CoA ligase